MKRLALIAVLLLFSPSAFADPIDDETEVEINDPLEPINRGVFTFNSYADKYVLRPVAVGYKFIIPGWGRQRVTNVFYNLGEPVTMVNSAIQGDPENSFTSLWRFLINSTVGIAGVFDAATPLGLKEHREDFGQTLGRFGYTNPPYLVLPLLGPSTLRDSIGLVVDYYSNPFYNGMVIDDDTTLLVMGVVNGVDKRANILSLTDDIERSSLDPYTTYRSYYMQNRESKINNSQDQKAITNY